MTSNSQATSPKQNLATHHAAATNDTKTIIKLLNNDLSSLEHWDEIGTTPLMAAARKGNTETFFTLLEFGADVAATNKLGVSVLSMAVAGGNMDIVQHLLGYQDVLEAARTGAMPPLCVAAMLGYTAIAKVLLDAGLGGSVGEHGMTALMFAATFNQLETMALLREHGEDIFQKNIAGMVAFEMLDQEVPDKHLENMENVPANDNRNACQDATGSGIYKRRNVALPKIRIHEVSDIERCVQRSNSARCVNSVDKPFRFSPYCQSFQENNLKEVLLGSSKLKNSLKPKLKFSYPNSAPPCLSPTVAIFFGNVSKQPFYFSPFSDTIPITPEVSPIEHVVKFIYPSVSWRDGFNNKDMNQALDKAFYKQLSVDDGCLKMVDILRQNKLNAFTDLFLQQEVDYAMFLTLSDRDLQHIGVASRRHRQQLITVIKQCLKSV